MQNVEQSPESSDVWKFVLAVESNSTARAIACNVFSVARVCGRINLSM